MSDAEFCKYFCAKYDGPNCPTTDNFKSDFIYSYINVVNIYNNNIYIYICGKNYGFTFMQHLV